MSLYNGIDYVAIVSLGVYTETYGAAHPASIANLYASLGYLEDVPMGVLIEYYLRGAFGMGMSMFMGAEYRA
jgi:hypothetical protein